MALASLFGSRTIAPLHWPSLIQSAVDESLLPAIWPRIQSLGLDATVPPEISQLLQTTQSLNRERNLRILSEATQVATLLNTIGIQPVALKGLAYILTGTYPDLADRFLQDIDLLIPKNRLTAALSLMQQHGFGSADTDPLSPLRHHPPPIQRPFAPPIEIHHSLGTQVCRRLLPASEIIQQAKPISIDGAQFLLPTPTHLANHLIFHAQLLDPYRETVFPSLRSLHDLQRLIYAFPIDWNSLTHRYQSVGHSLTLALYLKQAEHILALPPPFPLTLGPFGRVRWAHRQFLGRRPKLRFVDPFYLFFALVARRSRLLAELIHQPGNWACIADALFTTRYYRNLLRL